MEDKLFLNIASSTFLILVSVFLVTNLNKTSYKPAKATKSYADKNVIVRGLVAQNNRDCVTDSACFLRIIKEDKTINVVYKTANFVCKNPLALIQGAAVKNGEKVEVFGYQYSKDLISICESSEYYIQKQN